MAVVVSSRFALVNWRGSRPVNATINVNETAVFEMLSEFCHRRCEASVAEDIDQSWDGVGRPPSNGGHRRDDCGDLRLGVLGHEQTCE